MNELNKEPQDVNEDLDVIIATGDKATTLNEFMEKVEDVKKKNVHKNFDRLDVAVLSKNNAAVLMLRGVRKENKQELDDRVSKEEAKRKSLDEHEFKEFLRLKKKFDKRKEE